MANLMGNLKKKKNQNNPPHLLCGKKSKQANKLIHRYTLSPEFFKLIRGRTTSDCYGLVKHPLRTGKIWIPFRAENIMIIGYHLGEKKEDSPV